MFVVDVCCVLCVVCCACFYLLVVVCSLSYVVLFFLFLGCCLVRFVVRCLRLLYGVDVRCSSFFVGRCSSCVVCCSLCLFFVVVCCLMCFPLFVMCCLLFVG